MKSSYQVKRNAFLKNEVERKARSLDLKARLLAKIVEDPEGIWRELFDEIFGDNAEFEVV